MSLVQVWMNYGLIMYEIECSCCTCFFVPNYLQLFCSSIMQMLAWYCKLLCIIVPMIVWPTYAVNFFFVNFVRVWCCTISSELMLYHEYKNLAYDSFVVMTELLHIHFNYFVLIFKSQNSRENLHTCIYTVSNIGSDYMTIDC